MILRFPICEQWKTPFHATMKPTLSIRPNIQKAVKNAVMVTKKEADRDRSEKAGMLRTDRRPERPAELSEGRSVYGEYRIQRG